MKCRTKILIFIILTMCYVSVPAQTYTLSKSGTSGEIRGTSSLHDWKMDLKNCISGFRLVKEGSSIKNIDNVVFSCKAKDLKSESSLMDKKAYQALNADDFPEIKFSGTSLTGLTAEGEKISGMLNGKLSLAGVTREITAPFEGTLGNKVIIIKASAELLMTSFKITPPTAMLGTLKTGDKIQVLLSLNFVED